MFYDDNLEDSTDWGSEVLDAQLGPEAREATPSIRRLEADIERLLLITESLWGILKEQHGYEDEELVKRVLEIDLRDGNIDGKVAAKPPSECPHCNRTLSKNRRHCVYCGEPVPVKLFAR